ncbi:MAG: radical SAM peptide maturase [Tannerellaceae bacterium]
MMNDVLFIPTKAQYQYVYSEKLRYFLYVPEPLKQVIENHQSDNFIDDYYKQKFNFLKDHSFFDEELIHFQKEYDVELVIQNMACLRQLLIEVTDFCNLKCKYCGYGELYANYDSRERKNQTFANVKILIDYLSELWASEYNISHNNNIIIGFYGGEPLLNMKLIKETINYVSKIEIPNLTFSYNMTTNGVLLNRYMDFLVANNFSLLISLDGNEVQNSYRLDKQGRSSFSLILDNLNELKRKYPIYFNEKVNFNSVLHDRNSVEQNYYFFYNLFGKVPRVSELNPNGIAPESIAEFSRIFNNRETSFDKAIQNKEIKKAFKYEDSSSVQFHSMLMNFVGNRFATYLDLFDTLKSDTYIPTGTCKPFERKLFLTVNGKILPCERIGQHHVLAKLENGNIELNSEAVAQYYSSLYERIIKLCSHCQSKRTCGQCLFLLEEKSGHINCLGFQNRKKRMDEFSSFLSYAESLPSEYEDLLSSIIID